MHVKCHQHRAEYFQSPFGNTDIPSAVNNVTILTLTWILEVNMATYIEEWEKEIQKASISRDFFLNVFFSNTT